MKQVKIIRLKQTGKKSVDEFTDIINDNLKALPNSRVASAFMPNINSLFVVIEYDA